MAQRLDRALPLPIDDPGMMTPYSTLALLQAAPPRAGGGMMLGIQVVLILAIFYFMMVRPQQTQRKRHESSLMGLKKGDEIITAGGIIGKVIHIKQGMKDGAAAPSLEDAVTIQSGESRLIVERGRIARIGSVVTAAQPVEKVSLTD
jgi:preprotein translocase subunit YajC